MLEEKEIVIVGGGICGLATALALHRKGIKSRVLEKAAFQRTEGAGISIQQNGWRALDQLGVGHQLRAKAIPIVSGRDIFLYNGKQQDISFRDTEIRCLKRSDLIEIMAENLPSDTIRFGCQIVKMESDPDTSHTILHLQDETVIMAKVVIGCDGVRSVVGDWLDLKPTKRFNVCGVSGFTNYPNGHGFSNEFVRIRGDHVMVGRSPVTDKLMFWFVARPRTPQDTMAMKEPKLLRDSTVELIKDFPEEIPEIIKKCDLDSVTVHSLRHRAPWDMLVERFRKGTVTVAGDAMHVMGPFVGQGGAAALEDAIVLGRCLAQAMAMKPMAPELDSERSNKNSWEWKKRHDEEETAISKRIEKAIDRYVKERRMRILRDTEIRCLKRSDLIEIMAENLPSDTIRFGCQIVKMESDPNTSHTILHLQDGTVVKAKVVIGCDGVRSMVGDWLDLKPTKHFNVCGVSGFTNYPNRHGFGNELVRIRGNNVLVGRLPINDKLIYWFVARPRTPQDTMGLKEPKLLRDSTVELLKDIPEEIPEIIKKCDLDSLTVQSLRHRAPWDILVERFRKGTVTVAGDAMHVMGPFVGQGGAAALEDSIVLGRCLAQEMVMKPMAPELDSERSNKNSWERKKRHDEEETTMSKRIEKAIDRYVKERWMRILRLATQTYLIGTLLQTKSLVTKCMTIIILSIFSTIIADHTRYDCGRL